MERIEITKEVAETCIQLWEEAEAKGWEVGGFSIGDSKYYGKEFLEAVRENGGIVIEMEPVIKNPTHVVVPHAIVPCYKKYQRRGMFNASSNKTRRLMHRSREKER